MKKVIILLIVLCFVSVANSRGYILIDGGGSQGIGTSPYYPGTWSDSAFKWALSKIGYNKDFVVVYYSSYDASWWSTYLRSLGHTGNVKVVKVQNAAQANNPSQWPDVFNQNTGFIWFPGGDQSNYVPILKNTKLGDSIKVRYFRDNICIGGTSAGAMIVGEYVSTGSSWPNEAIRNPYNSYLSYDRNVLPLLENYLVDTHVAERGRLGRMLAHLGRIEKDYGEAVSILGLDDCTALCVDSNLIATVIGTGTVSILRTSLSTRRVVQSGRPLVLTDLCLVRAGDRFVLDLNSAQVISIPSTAETITTPPNAVIPPPSTIFLVGGKPDQRIDQSTPLSQFLNSCGVNPVIAIITADTSNDTINMYRNNIISLGASRVYLVELSPSQVNNPLFSQYIEASNGIIFLKNNLQNAGQLLTSSNLVSQSYWQKINSGTPQMFIGLDCWLVNERVIYNTESGDYNAYYGRLMTAKGLNLIPGFFVSPAAFVPENSSSFYIYIESKVDGLLWLLTYFPGSLGLLLDGASYEFSNDETWVKISPDGDMRIYSGGNGAPVVIVDAFQNQYMARSTWKMRTSSAGPRQNGQLTPILMHVLDSNYSYNITARGVLSIIEPQREDQGFDFQYIGTDKIKVSWNFKGMYRYGCVYDVRGDLMDFFYLNGVNNVIISLPKRKGVYFLELVGPGNRSVSKFVRF